MTRKQTLSKARYHVAKTREWLEGEGYTVYPMEHSRTVWRPGKDGGPGAPVFVKQDTRGADLLAVNDEHEVWVQVKANPADVSKGVKEFHKHRWPAVCGVVADWPIRRWVVNWAPRRRTKDGPEITEVF